MSAPLVFFIGNILPYFAVAVFVAGMAYRILGWLSVPVPLKLTLAPAPQSSSGVVKNIASEMVLFLSLLHGDRRIWAAAWSLHVLGLLILLGHLFGLPDVYLGLSLVDRGKPVIALLGFGILVPVLYLIVRRFVVPDVARLTLSSDYIVLALILVQILSGDYITFFSKLDLPQAADFIMGVLTLHPVPPPDNPAFILHFFTFQLLLMYLPFSKLVHPLGMLFSRTMTSQVMATKAAE